MTLAELAAILKSTGLPVAYSHFKSDNVPPPPFIAYTTDSSSNFFADNQVYREIENVVVELYTDKKDLAAEKALESVLKEHDLPFETIETWIEEEQLFQRIYELGVIIDGE